MQKNKKIESYVVHFDQLLGKGTYADVYLCHHQSSKVQYACKVIKKSLINQSEYCKNAMKQELAIHQSLHHKNIVEFIDVIQTANNYYLIQQYCPNGNLRDFMRAYGKLSESDALHCLKALCEGFEEIFSKGIIHRDLKPENIILKGSELKIADFGFAKKIFSQRQLTQTMIGTPLYMAPQILKKQRYSSKCDVWSISVIYYELLYGMHPWTGHDIPSLLHNILNSPLNFPEEPSVSEETKSFLIHCLQLEENQRLSWLEVFEHNLLGSFFEQKAKDWRQRYVWAANKLNELSKKITVEQLIGCFLQLRVCELSFDQFSLILRWLIPELSGFGMCLSVMYELFDKDQNGTIDIQQFVGAFNICEEPVLKIFKTLLNLHPYYEELSDYSTFLSICEENSLQDEQQNEKCFTIICNIKLEP